MVDVCCGVGFQFLLFEFSYFSKFYEVLTTVRSQRGTQHRFFFFFFFLHFFQLGNGALGYTVRKGTKSLRNPLDPLRAL